MFKLGCTSDKIWHIDEFIKFLVANQNKKISITVYPEAVDLELLGVYKLLDMFKFEQVNIHTYNPFESSNKYNIIVFSNPWLKKQEIVSEDLHNWNFKKKFFCFFHRPTASRLGIAGYLFANYTKDSLIHFSSTVDPDNLIQFELDKLLSYRIKSVEDAGNILNHLPLLLSSSDRYTYNQGYYYDDPLTNFYQDILVDVVVESHVLGKTFFPTEKTTRPIWLKKPFIIFGSRNYLDYLHQLGFRTFSDFWDETYDGYEGPDRFNQILKLIDSLSQKSVEELEEMYWSMTYTLDHNYNLLKQQSFNTNLTYID
jgi:hypothetical protein